MVVTERLLLRPYKADDVPSIIPLAGDWEIVRQTARAPHPFTAEHARALVNRCRIGDQTGERLLAIELRDGAHFVGGLSLIPCKNWHRLSYWLGRPYWGLGLATEAVEALTEHAFANLGATCIRAGVFLENKGSARVLDKAGYVCLGERINDFPFRGGSRRHFVYARRRADPMLGAPQLLVAAGAMVDGLGRVLLARRPTGKTMAGAWEFPGGKVAEGETVVDALVRELFEELGINADPEGLDELTYASHHYDSFHLVMPLFLVHSWRGTPKEREGQELVWTAPSKLANYEMPPADAPMIPVVIAAL